MSFVRRHRLVLLVMLSAVLVLACLPSGVEPTKSTNITVSCRRSASVRFLKGAAAERSSSSWGSAVRSVPPDLTAASSFRRWPSVIPRSIKSWSVRCGSTSRSMSFWAKTFWYCLRPRFSSQVAMSLTCSSAPCSAQLRSQDLSKVEMKRSPALH